MDRFDRPPVVTGAIQKTQGTSQGRMPRAKLLLIGLDNAYASSQEIRAAGVFATSARMNIS